MVSGWFSSNTDPVKTCYYGLGSVFSAQPAMCFCFFVSLFFHLQM